MEVQMKAICEGRSTRQDVVQQNLEKYRAVFDRTAQQINVLKLVCQYVGFDLHRHVAYMSVAGYQKVRRGRSESWLKHLARAVGPYMS
jgi:DNA topoisomerase-3